MDCAVQIKALSASQIVRAKCPVARLLLGNVVERRIVDPGFALANPGRDIIFCPLLEPRAASIDALPAKFALQRTDLLLAHHVGYLRPVPGPGPDLADLFNVDIDLGYCSHSHDGLSGSGSQDRGNAARLSGAGGRVYHQHAVLAFAHDFVDRVQHPILVGPEGFVWEIVQVHMRMIILGRDKCSPQGETECCYRKVKIL